MSESIIIRILIVIAPFALGASPLIQGALAAPAAAKPPTEEKAAPAEEKEKAKPAEGKKKAAPAKRQAAPGNQPIAAKPAKKPAGQSAAREAKKSSSKEDPRDEHVDKLKAEVDLLNLERDKLVAENVIAKESIIKELAEREAATERVEMDIEEGELEMKQASLEQKIKLERELADLRAEKERYALEAEISKAKADAEISRLKLEQEQQRSRLAKLTTEIEEKEKTTLRNNYAEETPVYLTNPLEGKKLTISDRRITMNGLVSSSTADYVSERINYFNNKDPKMPIFVVIDYSPGGSVMSGYKIMKAMEGSEAPVYVVVKSFAASMAACITTLADKSFAYPNAIVLHHQLSGMSYGNLTRQKEFVEEAEEWWRRLAGPVAEKMGVGLDEFIEMMYENASTGDWVEFADKAKKLHWVDHVIEEIHETSLIKNPDADSEDNEKSDPSTYHYGLQEQIDDEGRPFVNLPRLAPYDYYWLYNPDEYYR